MSTSAESIGSLVIDLRANVAQLRVDMDEVKNTVAKSSREMSSQMKQDMNETRQVLALMRDDFGVGVPRELRKVIASSELARTAILGIKDALFGLAFINLGIEAFNKISEYIAESAKKAEEEAKHTRDIVDAAQKAVDATFQRREQLALIGKGEEDRAALQKKYFADEIERNKTRLAGLQAEIAAKVALLNIDAARAATPEVFDPATGMSMGFGSDEAAGEKVRQDGLKAIQKLTEELKPQIEAAQKAIDAAIIGTKTADVQLADFERNLGISRLKNSEMLALKDVEIRRDANEKLFEEGKIGLDQELMALRTAATEKYNIQQQSLQDTLAILEQDPSRNKEKIEQVNTQLQLLDKDHQKELTDIAAQGAMARLRIHQQEIATEAAMASGLLASNKDHSALPADLFNMGGGTPKLDGTLAGFKQSIEANVTSTLKDAAAQGKLLTQAMEGLLSPTDRFEILQAEIAPLLKEYAKQPDVVKALTAELLKANPEFEKLMQASAEFGKDLANELDSLILKGESFSDFLKNIAKDIEEIALKALLLKPLEDFLSGKGGSGGGITGFLGHIFSGLGFAGGGNPPVDQISLVGENGPELFMPSTAGTIIPNGSFGGDTYNYYIDARNAAPGTEAAMIRALQKMHEKTRRAAIAGAIDYQRRR